MPNKIWTIILILMILTLSFQIHDNTASKTFEMNHRVENIVYVSTIGSTYNTIQDAVDDVEGNTTIIVGEGIYYESVYINKSYINIVGNNTDKTFINTTKDGDIINQVYGGFIFSINANDISISNFTLGVNYNQNYGIYIYVGDNNNINQVKFHIHGDNSYGCYLIKPNNTTITKSDFITINSFGSYGINILTNLTYNTNISYCKYNITGENSCGVSATGRSIISNCNYNVTGSQNVAITLAHSNNIIVKETNILIGKDITQKIGIHLFQVSNINIINTSITSYGLNNIGVNALASDITIDGLMVKNESIGSGVIKSRNSVIYVKNSPDIKRMFDYDIIIEEGSILYWIDSGDPIFNGIESSYLYIYKTIIFQFLDEYNNNITNLDVKISESGFQRYSTQYYDGNDPSTDDTGKIKPILFNIKSYINSNNADYSLISIKMYKDYYEYSRYFSNLEKSLEIIKLNIYKPQTPYNINVTPIFNSQLLNISWNSNDIDIVSYNIYSNKSGEWQLISTTEKKYLIDGPFSENEIVFYQISSFDGLWESEISSSVSGESYDITPPIQPTNFNYKDVGATGLTLIWDLSPSIDVIEYIIYINETGTNDTYVEIVRLPPIVKEYKLTGLSPNTTYYFNIIAFDEARNPSMKTEDISINTLKDNGSIFLELDLDEHHPLKTGVSVIVKNMENIDDIFYYTDKIDELLIPDVPLNKEIQILIIPLKEDMGIINERSGYLNVTSDSIILNNSYIYYPMKISLMITYYVFKEVAYGEIYGMISYKDLNENLIPINFANVTLISYGSNSNKTTISDFRGYYEFNNLVVPGNYSLIITPPINETGIINERSGILKSTTELIVLLEELPLLLFDVVLDYYYHDQINNSLTIIDYGPIGINVDVNTNIWIKFDRSIDLSSFIISFSILPGIGETIFSIDNSTNTIFIGSEPLKYASYYEIVIKNNISHPNGTEYEFDIHTWNFSTIGNTQDNNGENGFASIIIAIIIILILFCVICIIIKRRKKNEDVNSVIQNEKMISSDTSVIQDDTREFFNNTNQDYYENMNILNKNDIIE